MLFALILGILFAHSLTWLADADHYTCHWREGPKSPYDYGYKHYCLANHSLVDPIKSTMVWTCIGIYNQTVSPANWNMVAPLALEFATPCGKGGWYLSSSKSCGADYFAMCLKPAEDCWYMHDEDDCQWPDLYNVNELPKTVDIWYKAKPRLARKRKRVNSSERSDWYEPLKLV
ncbi:hypothetical protein BDZ90DRAFT_45002 [Jaminaea rosea]|uniref:Uncharacterized protein n=1 Tax=Jaminaea rosea TaxID=1569628 RepID=A0A316UNV2_9BASI|nr:hypothetical protein BDZ90DRAFT_45002 [Jaminaea rosea]PWN26634.1 hypothetical protein BDZ90DRAFT_45002 [Jaminaea rosea]